MTERIEDKYLAQAFSIEARYLYSDDTLAFIDKVNSRAKTLQSEAKAPLGYYCSVCATTFKTPVNCGAGNCPGSENVLLR